MIQGHGDDAYRFERPIRADFSSNVYSHLDLVPLKEHLRSKLDVIGHYPEPEPYRLEAALAGQLGQYDSQVMVTAGATEAIYLIAHAFSGCRSDILQPTFSEYGDACRMYGHEILRSAQEDKEGAQEEMGADLAAMPRATDGLAPAPLQTPFFARQKGQPREVGHNVALRHSAKSDHETDSIKPAFADTDLFWMCNPNNPDGYVMPKEALTSVIESHRETVFVIDQSYGFFTREPLLSAAEAARYPNVLQLHSMTKRYAMPGLRLGYVTGNADFIALLREVRMPWSVNALAIEAGLYLMEHPDTAPIDLDALLAEAARLRDELNAIPGLSVEPTQTHFMLCKLAEGKAADLKEWLACERGLLIRDASNFEGLGEGCFRIATQTAEENDMLVRAIRAWQEARR